MNTYIFSFCSDFAGETTETVLEDVGGRAQIGNVVLAANYHTARDFFPHNPGPRLHVTRGGSLFLDAAEATRTSIGATCPVDALALGEHSFVELVKAVQDHGMGASGWVNYCHLDNFAVPPRTLCQNAFGDPEPSMVCPANPEVSEFAVALTRDVARAGAQEIFAEAMHFAPVTHGYHHERWFIELSELVRYLLGLCFCQSCRQGIADHGADPKRLAAAVRGAVELEISRGPAGSGSLGAEGVTAAIGEEARALWAHREGAVRALQSRVGAAAMELGCRLTLVDPSGAVRGYSSGRPTGETGPIPGWVLGNDLSRVPGAGSVAVLAYMNDPERLRQELSSYAGILEGVADTTVILRPGPPDSLTSQELGEKVAICRSAGAGGLAFYHYALMRLDALDWICQALA